MNIKKEFLYKKATKEIDNLLESFSNEELKSIEKMIKKGDIILKKLQDLEKIDSLFFKKTYNIDVLTDLIENQLRAVYQYDMGNILSEENYNGSLGLMNGYYNKMKSFNTNFFNGIIISFQNDIKKVLDNYSVIYNNFNLENNKKMLSHNYDIDNKLLGKVIKYALDIEMISATLIQRVFNIPYIDAEKIIKILEDNNFICKEKGSQPRRILKDNISNYFLNKFEEESCYFSILFNNPIVETKEKDLIDIIDSDINGYEFEKISKDILEKNSYENVIVTQSSGDFGVDVIAFKDGIKYAIQCKKYSSPVGIKAIQEVIGSKAMNNCHVAVVLTNNYFTKSARELANKNNVLLWDRNILTEMIKIYNHNKND